MLKRIVTFATFILFMMVGVVQATENKLLEDNLPGLRVGSKAPNFELITLEGETVRLSDFKGQKIMLNFWATWCPPCKAEMPDMQQFYIDNHEQIKVLAVNIDPQNNVAGYVKKMKLSFPILLDKEEKVSRVYQILSIPTTYFLDESGVIKKKHIGAMSQKQMKEYIKNL